MAIEPTTKDLPVLVVDDEENIRASIARSLSRIGFETVQAGTAEDALEILGRQSVSCAITDLKMPGMGGHAFVRKCRDLLPALPIMVISGHGDMDDVIEAMREGAADYLKKPWGDSEIREIVRRLVSKSRGALPVAEAARPPAPVAAPAARAKAPDPENTFARILMGLRRGEVPLPAAPSVAMAARDLTTSESGSAQAMRELIERDTYLTSQVLRLSNSSFYARRGRVNSLQEAIARVGFREIGLLVDALIAKQFFALANPELQRLVSAMWQKVWTRAVSMRFLAEELRVTHPMPDRAYVAGLLADVGFPILLKILSERMPGRPTEEYHQLALEHHAVVGACTAEAWALPTECVELCRSHHVTPRPGDVSSPLFQLFWAAEEVIGPLLDAQFVPDPKSLGVREALKLDPTQLELIRARTVTFLETHQLDVG